MHLEIFGMYFSEAACTDFRRHPAGIRRREVFVGIPQASAVVPYWILGDWLLEGWL